MKRSTWTLAVSLMTVAGGVAAAQPNGGEPPVPTDNPLPPPTNPNPNPNPPPNPNPNPPPLVGAPIASAETGERPTELAVGIGVGYTFPTPLDMVNTVSARLRLPSGITLEPRVIVENSSASASTMGISAPDRSAQRFRAAMVLRVPLVKHGKFDFELLGEVDLDSIKTPNMTTPDTDSDRVTALALGWGIAVGWWLSPHFEISTSATNPLVQFTRSTTTANDTTSSTTDLGLIFDPRVSVMIHVYY